MRRFFWSGLVLCTPFILGTCGGDDDEAADQTVQLGATSSCDADGDGHLSLACGGDDCDDKDPNKYPPDHGCDKKGGCTWPPCSDPGPGPSSPSPDASVPTTRTIAPSSAAADTLR